MKIDGRPRVLLTGATGFVGSRIARRLIDDGWKLHIVLRPESRLDPIGDILGLLTSHLHDGSTESMYAIVEKAKPDIVFHLASLFLAKHEPCDVERMIRSNLVFSTQLVDAMVGNRIYSMVNTGTSWQHYENRDYSPVCLYAATKQAFECMLQYYIETSTLQVVTLKLSDTYGPNDPRKKLFGLLEKAATESNAMPMSPGGQMLDLVYIDDVVDAFIIAAERLKNYSAATGTHECFAVTSGEQVCLREIVRLYESTIGKSLRIEWGGRPYREREMMVPWNKGAVLPGWHPKISLQEGIRRTVFAVSQGGGA